MTSQKCSEIHVHLYIHVCSYMYLHECTFSNSVLDFFFEQSATVQDNMTVSGIICSEIII